MKAVSATSSTRHSCCITLQFLVTMVFSYSPRMEAFSLTALILSMTASAALEMVLAEMTLTRQWILSPRLGLLLYSGSVSEQALVGLN